ncbi:hypothetical protein GCM10011581_04990 [Saccharopolyspora subtropica]|uniref:Uncharacterized protein n=1 Tax=Saccharopolyspora thermophila TaxID=89367 RepID=A0A917JKJ5_9PSEU|nr:hypothetical protein GCM10011581_04990 [Saccharopolyspora subtropica]
MPDTPFVLQQPVHDNLLTRSCRRGEPRGADGPSRRRPDDRRTRSDPMSNIVTGAGNVTTRDHNHLFRRKILNSTTQAQNITTSVTG